MNIKAKSLIKYLSKFFPAVYTLILIITFQSCEEDPNDLGIGFIPTVDTTGVRFLDSQTDTMAITSNNYKQFLNDFGAQNILVGNYQNYESKALLRFKGINVNYDSSNVISASLSLRYSNYYFKDKSGSTVFDMYRLNTNFNYRTITYDSVSSSSYGNTSVGSFSGVVPDSSTISFLMDNQTIKDWLEYAADTNYAIKNYGLMMLPSMSSSTIRGFYLFNDNIAYIPTITVILSKNGDIDTITLNSSESVSISNAPTSIIPNERFLLQNGIAYRNILNFDLSKLPANVIINNATLLFTIDNSNSFVSSTTDKRILIGTVVDSVAKKDSIFFEASLLDTIIYSVSLNSMFQRWNSGNLPNLGVTMKNYSEIENLDNFAIYSPAAADINKRPRLKITYTKRN